MTETSKAATKSAARELVITRIFDAPRELVFATWTEPRHLAQWFGPKGFTNPVCEVDLRPGGSLYVEMTDADGSKYPAKGIFREIIPPERLVFTTTAFEDESGNPQLEGLNTVTFEDFNGKTKLTLHVTMLKVVESPQTAFAMAGMEQGWSESLDKLGDELARSSNATSAKGGVMYTVKSADGTTIAFDKTGNGPALILVGGMFEQRAMDSETAQLAALPLLAEQFTVYHYDRRGRGDSTDTLPFAVEREIEDIEALIDEAGGSAFVFGISSGAALAMEAAIKLGNKVRKLAMYEAPYNDDAAARQAWRSFTSQLKEALADGRRGDAVGLFMTLLGAGDHLNEIRKNPMWSMWEGIAPTIAYDAAALGEDASVPTERAARVAMSALVMDGSASYPFMHITAEALEKAMPHAQHRTLEGQTHEVKAEALAPVLIDFFKADDQPQHKPLPKSGLKTLDKLVGTWTVSGDDIRGQVRFEWMDGGFFLMQHVDMVHGGNMIKGVEIIGYERGWDTMGQPEDKSTSQDITSHWFDNAGNTFTYTWEIEDDTLTIWGGAKGSPAFYRGKFSADGNTNSGAWQWPGGGYQSTMTRVK